MNIELLRKVKNAILENPRRINMRYWCRNSSLSVILPTATLLDNTCDTVGCIAGWTCAISGAGGDGPDVPRSAKQLLKLPPASGRKLFYPEKWPREWQQALDSARDASDRKLYARVVADYIDYFIANYGETKVE